jgi:hypothetical protein
MTRTAFRGLTLTALAGLLGGAAALETRAQSSVIDSVSAVFRNDSAKAAAVRSVEAGGAPNDSLVKQRGDSLLIKMQRRGPYIGLSLGVSFTDNSSKELFDGYMRTTAAADSQRILQAQDPVHLVFPAGFVLGFPLFPNFDVWLRTESFWYRVTGLAQKNNEAAREFWYAVQGHLAGVGARYLVPGSLLSVNGKPGLYAAYTHFWNFGPTGIYSPDGSVRARLNPAGAGYEFQLGFQQDFDKRFTYTGGLSFSQIRLESPSPWNAVVPNGPATAAEWKLQSLRLSFQALYQFGR